MEFLLLEDNLAFSVAIAVMIGIGLLEGLATLVGFGISSVVDSILPDFDVDADISMASASPVTQFLSWLHIGKVPSLVLIIVFLTSFGLIGLFSQRIALAVNGQPWPIELLAFPVFIASLPCVSLFGGVLGRLIPKEETEAVSELSFIGSEATVTLGVATKGKPTQARVKDAYGQSHYILVEPQDENMELQPGQTYKIAAMNNNIYLI